MIQYHLYSDGDEFEMACTGSGPELDNCLCKGKLSVLKTTRLGCCARCCISSRTDTAVCSGSIRTFLSRDSSNRYFLVHSAMGLLDNIFTVDAIIGIALLTLC